MDSVVSLLACAAAVLFGRAAYEVVAMILETEAVAMPFNRGRKSRPGPLGDIALPDLPEGMQPGWLTHHTERDRYEGVDSQERYRVKVPAHVMHTHKDWQRFRNRKVPGHMQAEFMRSDFWLGQKRLRDQSKTPRELRDNEPDTMDEVIVQDWPPMASPEKDPWSEDEDDRRYE